MKIFLFLLLPVLLLVLPAWKIVDGNKTISWHLRDTQQVGGFKPVVLGNPTMKIENKDSAIYFNGVNDGFVIPVIPMEGWPTFAVEVLFKPDSDGSSEPRFIHFEDTALNRGTLELRLTKNGQWYFDGFLKNGKTGRGVTLIDSTKLHPANQWYRAALVYDGKKMYTYINGQKELEGAIDFPPMTKGNISLGVRLNKKNWFKGQIREINFHSFAKPG